MLREGARGRLIAVALFLTALGLYVNTLGVMPTDGDSCELAANALLGRVLHPPGYPLYGSLLRLSALIPLGTAAWKCGLVSALSGALACALLFVVARRLGFGSIEAAGAALLFAGSSQPWIQATRVEVYAFEVCLFLAVVAAYLAWDADEERTSVDLAWWGLLGLAIGHRYNAAVAVPVFVVHAGRRLCRDRRLLALRLATLAAGCCLPLTLFLGLDMQSPIVYGPGPVPLARVLWGGGGYARYLFAFPDGGVPGRCAAVADVLAQQATLVGLLLAVAGWVVALRRLPQGRTWLALGLGGAHLAFVFAYGVSDVATMVLPAWSMLALGWAGLFTATRRDDEAPGLVETSPIQRFVCLVCLALALLWWNTPIQANENSPALYQVMAGFHRQMRGPCHVYAHRTEEQKLFALHYVNEIEGPRKPLVLNTFTFDGWQTNADLAVAAIGAQLAAGERVYVAPLFPAVTTRFTVEPAGPFSRITALRPAAGPGTPPTP